MSSQAPSRPSTPNSLSTSRSNLYPEHGSLGRATREGKTVSPLSLPQSAAAAGSALPPMSLQSGRQAVRRPPVFSAPLDRHADCAAWARQAKAYVEKPEWRRASTDFLIACAFYFLESDAATADEHFQAIQEESHTLPWTPEQMADVNLMRGGDKLALQRLYADAISGLLLDLLNQGLLDPVSPPQTP